LPGEKNGKGHGTRFSFAATNVSLNLKKQSRLELATFNTILILKGAYNYV